ncbi:MAG: hypothetical protein SGARI_000029, partial [Bacillariaceae sp.]
MSRRKNAIDTRTLVLGFLVLSNLGTIFQRMDSVTSPERQTSTPAMVAPQIQKSITISRWERAMQDADEMLLSSAITGEPPDCLRPDTNATAALVARALQSKTATNDDPSHSLPILNMGMPKTGSTTLAAFFQCVGLNGTHQEIVNARGEKDFEGLCMRDAVNAGLPPIETCSRDQQYMMQLDVDFPIGYAPSRRYTNGPYISSRRDECFFPQLSLLEEFHHEVPQATFVMNFRPMQDWVNSMKEWGKPPMIQRFRQCHLPNLPRGIPHDIDNELEVMKAMEQFMCSHVLHVRQFVEDHPNHALIELDLYDTDTAVA